MQQIKQLVKQGIFFFSKNVYALYPVKECPVCEAKYYKFQRFNGRDNALCYNCRSMERDRLHYLYLKQHTTLFDKSEKKMLHVAPEKCIYNKIINYDNIDYDTADYMVTLNLKYQVEPKHIMSITNIIFVEEYFDFLMCSHVLDDVDDDAKAISEIFRVLKSGGIALISVPVLTTVDQTIELKDEPGLRETMKISSENARVYGLDVIDRLRKPGFKVQMLKASDFFSKEKMDHYAIRDKDIFYICSKPYDYTT